MFIATYEQHNELIVLALRQGGFEGEITESLVESCREFISFADASDLPRFFMCEYVIKVNTVSDVYFELAEPEQQQAMISALEGKRAA